MTRLKQIIADFRSIFFTDDVLKENEKHANVVTANIMINLYWICVLTWILDYLNVFNVTKSLMNLIMASASILLLLPGLICFILKGNNKYLKYSLLISFVFMVAIADIVLKNNATLIIILPVILASRYYNKKFTFNIALLTGIAFIASTIIGLHVGQQDINTYNLILSKGTTITINTDLKEALSLIDVDQSQRLINTFIHFFLPKIFVFIIASYACMRISESGRNMIEKQKEITAKGARIETELNLANAIQKSMLPSIFPPFPEHDEIDLYATMIPAKEVGGDFYDMFLIDDDHVAICVSDVSGKGVPASLVMMITKILIKNVVKTEKNIDKAFTRVNNMLCDGNTTGIFITSWFGVLDLRTGVIRFVNAGHNQPLVYSHKKKKYTYLESKTNLVLAGMEDIKYLEQEITIEPGDKLFLYTDGVVEATNKQNELYGDERLEEYLNNNINLDPNKTITGVKKDIDKFVDGAEQFDDITMLSIEFKSKKKEVKSIRKEFKADVKELNKIQKFIKKELDSNNCDELVISQVELSVEEIFVNIAKYAYEDKNGKCIVEVQNDGHNLKFIFEDSGVKFNPLEKSDPDTKLSAEERDIGGLGIFLVKKNMDNVEYKYEDGKNILILSKKI